jgi:dolichol-phosphate mannosyltransferase
LLDIVSTAGKSLRVTELPYQFRSRHRGVSKLDTRIALNYAGLVLARATSGLLSLRFIFFCMVGIVGIGVHFVVLSLGVALFGLSFQWAQILAIVVAIANNFALNNAITYRDQRLTGVNYLIGLLLFYLISSIGALSNMSVGSLLFGHQQTWWVAGLGGAIMSVVELRHLVNDDVAQPLKVSRAQRWPVASAAPRCARRRRRGRAAVPAR